MTNKLILNKLDVVQRQLETAIYLYFDEGDPVSIHTLAAAAYNIVRDMTRDSVGMPINLKGDKSCKDKKASLIGPLYDYVRENKRKWLRDQIVKPENFFKHADRDPAQSLTFHPFVTDAFLWEAIVVFQNLTGRLPEPFHCYRTWFQMVHPEVFDYPAEVIAKIKEVGRVSRREFRDDVFPYMRRHSQAQ